MKVKKFTILILCFLLLIIEYSCNLTAKDLNVTSIVILDQIIVVNNDNFDYHNAKIEINDKFVIKDFELKADSTYTLDLSEFTDDDGKRFDFLTTKVQNFYIWCKLDEGGNGNYYKKL